MVLCVVFLCSGVRSSFSALFHHSVFDYMCLTVMFHRCGGGHIFGLNIYL